MARSKPGGKQASKSRTPIRDERWIHFYRQMMKIRLFEEQVNQLYMSAKMPGLAHLYIGQEAVAVGVCETLRQDDYITSTHRGHGHCLAKGASLDRMFAELLGKAPGYCRGKGGSMHIADQETGNLGANAIVAGSAGIATGAAMSAKMRGSDQVAVCFFGEGALGQGLLYECMNMASLWKLPVIYVCENNLYNEYTHYSETTAGEIRERAKSFKIPSQARSSKMSMPSKPSPSLLLPTGQGEGKQSIIASGKPIREITFAQAINDALAEEMRRDPKVFIIGEDVAEAGTPFKVLSGLVQ